ncbi:amino acid adenylation domain-containing protein [Streptomyces sp. ODS28]|uniref:non-ribosomal peptide synthetase family protein n=1 Tax=Streptomyces sp. ODS28 TaxID=3136688 RepID=UPI0031EB2333
MKTAHLSDPLTALHQGSLPALLRQQAAAQPDAVAVASDTGGLTFRELDRAATAVAARLRRLGAGADERIGLYADPSAGLITGAWGILFSGAAYLPLSPEYPEERLRHMIEDSRTRIVLTQEHLAPRLSRLVPRGTQVVTLGAAGAELPAVADEPPPATPDPRDLAYVIYTSGSTGRPKGVMIEHRSILSQMRWMHACGHLGRGTAVLQKTPMSFDAAQWEILAPVVGGRVVAGGPGMHRDPAALTAAVVAHRVTALQCVPTLLQALLEHEEFARCTSLRRVFCGGETLSKRLARAFTDELPWSSLVNLYGPTECTINATAHLVDPDTLGKPDAHAGNGDGAVPIGVPADNTQCYVLDENMAPVDIGETGELHIGGAQLARGYLERPDLTAERFVRSPFVPTERLYRTGDLAYWNPDGSLSFAGRADSQVKLRGHRIELEEVALAVEEHTWVRRAAALVAQDPRTGARNLVACVELDPREAALMDQGNHGGHHQSKASRLQVRAQLSDPGIREESELAGRPVLELPGARETERQRRDTFARKTYRHFEGGEVTREDLLRLLAPRPAPTGSGVPQRGPGELTYGELGAILRWFGQFRSEERLLPKYAYASPGALYATQLYVEAAGPEGAAGLAPGVYYHHPAEHTLVRVGDNKADEQGATPSLTVHFAGKRRAVEPVYRNNIREVLEFEAGHMVGLFQEVLPEHGLGLRPSGRDESVRHALDIAPEDHLLGSFAVVAAGDAGMPDVTGLYVQAHPGGVRGLEPGQYRHEACHARGNSGGAGAVGELRRIADALIEPRHVIAINQQVHERAGFGVTAVSRGGEEWLRYIALGAELHRLQRNGLGLGLMSSGYSSKSGHPLPAARRMDDILAGAGERPADASYFALGGRVSEEQIRSEGMREDAVHMRGPAEMIKEQLARTLPEFMIPHRVLVLDELPLTANGKVDTGALAVSEPVARAHAARPHVAPATEAERRVAAEWGRELGYEEVSMEDEFFASGGNSLHAVALVNRLNRAFGTGLPLQTLFECPTPSGLAARVAEYAGQAGNAASAPASARLVRLNEEREGAPVFCWPGLGGYPMNLRALGRAAGLGRPFHGIQAHGINPGETPYPTVREMAAADVAEIRRARPGGPYTLWGYSFGARVAFEAAWQLESAGEEVDHLFLLCPGNPEVRKGSRPEPGRERAADYRDPAYVTILYSVFAGSVTGPELDRCLEATEDEDTFAAFVHGRYPSLDEPLIRRIARVVRETYAFEYAFHELAERRLRAPVTLFKATGDDYAFIEGSSGYSAAPPTVIGLSGDHYGVLREPGVSELAAAIRRRLGR